MKQFFNFARALTPAKAERAEGDRLERLSTLLASFMPPVLEDPAPSSAVDSMVQLQRWSLGCDFGERRSEGLVLAEEYDRSWHPARLACGPLEAMITKDMYPDCEVAIRDVTRLANSKSPLTSFAELDGLGRKFCAERGFDISSEQIRSCLLHDQVRVATPWRQGSDSFCAMTWADAPIALSNDGGSHHFAAARYIAGQLDEPVPLRGTVHAYGVSAPAIAELHKDWGSFVLPKNELGKQLVICIGDMEFAAGVTDMPQPYEAMLLLIRRDGSRETCNAIASLEAAGAAVFQPFAERLLAQQARNHGLAHTLLGL